MTYSNSLADYIGPLILDASVLVNLHASTRGGHILNSLPNDIFVPEVVASELEHDLNKVDGEHLFLQDSASSDKVCLVALGDHEYEVFESLVSGSDSLGDGEAATIAIATRRKFLPVIDERKGRIQAQRLASSREPGWSLDLFLHPFVTEALGERASVDALYYALRDGHMRIQEDLCDYVVSVMGLRRALDCISLPNYKARRQHWQESIRQLNSL